MFTLQLVSVYGMMSYVHASASKHRAGNLEI